MCRKKDKDLKQLTFIYNKQSTKMKFKQLNDKRNNYIVFD